MIANFTGDRSRLLIQAGMLGLATVIDEPGLPARPESKATVQKLGLAGLLGLVVGILIASIAETMRPTVPGARRVSRRLSVPALGQLSGGDLNGGSTSALGELALRCRLAAAHAHLRTIALVDIDGKRDLAALAARADAVPASLLGSRRVGRSRVRLVRPGREGERQLALGCG